MAWALEVFFVFCFLRFLSDNDVTMQDGTC